MQCKAYRGEQRFKKKTENLKRLILFQCSTQLQATNTHGKHDNIYNLISVENLQPVIPDIPVHCSPQ